MAILPKKLSYPRVAVCILKGAVMSPADGLTCSVMKSSRGVMSLCSSVSSLTAIPSRAMA